MSGWPKFHGAMRLAALGAVVALCLNLAAAVAVGRPASAQAQNRAGLVVAFASGAVETRCVTFSEPSITGYELLRRSGLPFSAQVGGLGAAMCKIADDGCSYPAQSCFCKCEDPARGCAYWIYGQWTGSAWRYAGLGALARTITDGQIDGWVWDVGQADGAAVRLPAPSLDEICAPRIAPTRVAAAAPPATARAPAATNPAPLAPTAIPSATAIKATTAVAPAASVIPATATSAPTLVSTSAPPVDIALSTAAPPAPVSTATASASSTPAAAPAAARPAAPAPDVGIPAFVVIMTALGGGAWVWRRRWPSRGDRP